MLNVGLLGSGTGGLPLHGGNLSWAQTEFPAVARPWIDLSTGINPWGYLAGMHADWTRLPEPAALDSLLSAARTYYGVPLSREIVAVAGVELAIRLLPLILATPGRVAVVGPAYGSHADAWRSAEYDVAVVPDATRSDCRIVAIVSPNNPDGRIVDAGELNEIAERHQWLIADRSFADVCNEPAALQGPDNLIELRSFGKFFGLPGVRLGFVLAGPGPAARLRRVLGAWPLNAAALSIGERALRDTPWHDHARLSLQRAADALDNLLRRHLEVVGGTDLFRLVHTPDAAALFRHLGSLGILTRIFDYEPTWVRIGLPCDAAAEIRLADALADFSGHRL